MQLPSKEKVQTRIDETIHKFPGVDVLSYAFEDGRRPSFLGGRLMSKSRALLVEAGVVSLPKRSIAAMQTAHCYVDITNFDNLLTDGGRETEAATQKLCSFLHGLFQSADILTDGTSVQRVDFHGGRVHAVVVSQNSEPCSLEDLTQLVAFANGIRAIVPELVQEAYGHSMNVDARAGIDAGPCLAWDDGDPDGAEPIFLGSPANHAAKIAGNSQVPGIYLSDRITRHSPNLGLNASQLYAGTLKKGGAFYEAAPSLMERVNRYTVDAGVRNEAALSEGLNLIRKSLVHKSQAHFIFSRTTPPLRNVRFKKLTPSKSVRMEMAVIFADIDGFTAFVDNCIETGQLEMAAKYIYVLRREMASVVRDDCAAKKVRFIGDCIQAVIAAGTSVQTDNQETIRQAVLTATGLQRSVALCAERLRSEYRLAMSIGIEFGETPLSRAGIRGDRSVRLSCSNASRGAEREQSDCLSGRVKLGPKAAHVGAQPLRLLLEHDDTMSLENSGYISAILKRGLSRPAIQTAAVSARSSSMLSE